MDGLGSRLELMTLSWLHTAIFIDVIGDPYVCWLKVSIDMIAELAWQVAKFPKWRRGFWCRSGRKCWYAQQ